MKPEATTPEPELRPKSRAEVEAALQAKAQEIEADLEALQEEVRQLGRSFRAALWNHPLVSVGGSLVAGLLVGWVLGGLGRRRRPRLSKTHRALVSAYLEALVAEARKAVRRGRDPEQAIRKALEERVPLIIVQENDNTSEKGVLRSIGGAVLGLVGSAVSVALSRVLADALLDAFAAGQQTESAETEVSEA
ncbi:hypothetical protein ABUL39_02980 [Rhodothermus marinus]|uniref:hypothetical protein n=1 Tax=Rhodothermus marinus TaxID=29549 RepID=UPI0037C9F063